MDYDQMYPSKYIKAADLQGKKVTVIIGEVAMQDVGTDESPEKKPCLFFKGKEKALVLNKTNGAMIRGTHGPNTNDWEGKEVILRPDKTNYNGQLVDCIRIEMPVSAAAADEDMPF